MLIYIVDDGYLFITNQEINHANITSNLKFPIPCFDLTESQKGFYYSGIKLFSHLPSHIRSLSDDIKLLRKFLKIFFIATLFILYKDTLNFKAIHIQLNE